MEPCTTSSGCSCPKGITSTAISIKRGHHIAVGQTGTSTSAPTPVARCSRSTTLASIPHGAFNQLISPPQSAVHVSMISAPGYGYGQSYRGTTCCS